MHEEMGNKEAPRRWVRPVYISGFTLNRIITMCCVGSVLAGVLAADIWLWRLVA